MIKVPPLHPKGLAATLVVAACLLLCGQVRAQEPPGQGVEFRNGHAEAYVTFERPLKGSERGQLTRAGVRFIRGASSGVYLVKFREPALEALTNHALFVGIQSLEPTDKLSPGLRGGNPGQHAVNEDGTFAVNIQFYDDVNLGRALQLLRQAGVAISHVDQMLFGNRVIVDVTQQQIDELIQSVGVESIFEIPPPPKIDNANSQALSNVDDIQAAPFSLDGTGVILGIWDGGPVRITHQDFGGRVVLRDADFGKSFANRDHATHVSGTMIGSGSGNAAAEGMAPNGGTLFAWDFSGDTVTEQANGVSNDNIVISNHSWGSVVGWDDGSDTGNTNLFGAYTGTTSAWDDLVQDTGLIVVKSAGNDRNDCDPGDSSDCDGILGGDGQRYHTIPQRGNAKNVITVGSVGVSNGTGLSGFSSSGPTDDGRIKPDIVADGDSLTSTCIDPTETQDDFYCNKGGTSMSTPSTSGASALLVERYREPANYGTDPSPDVIKALFVNTATDLGRPGPDFLFGHGLIHALRAVQTIDAGDVRIITDSIDQDDVHEYLVSVPAGVDELRATLNWIDPEGGADANPAIVNDLDVDVVSPNFTTYYPWSGPGTTAGTVANNATASGPNSVDTVEHVSAPSPSQGFWTVNVRGSGVPLGPQGYALVINGLDSGGNVVSPFGFMLDDQPDIRVNAALAFNEICPGGQSLRTVTIFNVGGANLLVNSVSVSNTLGPENAFSLLPDPLQPVVVQPGAHVDFTVEFAASQPGYFEGELEILSNDPDQPSLTFPISGRSGDAGIDTLVTRAADTCLGDMSNFNLTISNPGSCPLVVSSITEDLPFWISGVVSFPLMIGAGDSLNVPITFQPAPDATCNDETDVTGTLVVASNAPAPSDSKNVLVRGLIPCPDLNLAIANSGDFGNVCSGGQSDLNLTLFNQGKCDLTISNILSDNPDNFVLPEDLQLPLVLSHDADFIVPIRFEPSAEEACSDDTPRTGVIQVTSDSPGEEVLDVDVSGAVPCPHVIIDPQSVTGIYAFPPTVVDTGGTLGCFTDRNVVLRNVGGCAATITDMSTDTADYSVIAPTEFPILLNPGEETLSATIRFTPQSGGGANTADEVTGVLSVSSDDPDLIDQAALCGEGVVQSGVRILATDVTLGVPMPIFGLDRLELASKGRNTPSPVSIVLTDVDPISTDVCGNTVQYHLNYEALGSANTEGGNPNSSYQARAKEGSLQASQNFNLGQCEFLEFQMQLTGNSGDDPPACVLKPKGDMCTLDSECCSSNCKGPAGSKTCK